MDIVGVLQIFSPESFEYEWAHYFVGAFNSDIQNEDEERFYLIFGGWYNSSKFTTEIDR